MVTPAPSGGSPVTRRRRADDRYYADCSLPSVREHSFTIWSNLDGLCRELTFIPSVGWYEDEGRDELGHFCLVFTLEACGDYDRVVTFINDCVRAENLLWNTDIEAMWEVTRWS